MEALQNIDVALFYFINIELANPVLDILMPFITNLNNWKIPILLVWIVLMIKGGKKGRVVAVLLIPVLVASDQVSAAVLKPLVGRVRPCHTLETVRLLVGCGGQYSFPSSHATNISAVALLFSFFYRRGTIYFVIIAFLVGFSRIYVGVHYPGDVVSGFLVGSALSALILLIYSKLAGRYPQIYYRPSLPR